MSTQSAKGTQELSHDPPQDLKQKYPERSSLLDDATPTETTKGSETTGNNHPKDERNGRDSPVKNNTIVENSWDSVGYV